MQLVQHEVSERAEESARVRIGQEKRQLLGRRHQDVGRLAALALTAVLRRVAGARFDGNGEAHFGDGHFEIALHVDGERLQGRDVERVERALSRRRAGGEIDEARQEARERLARTRGRDEERGSARLGEGKKRKLMGARAPAAAFEPAGKEWGERCGVRRDGERRCHDFTVSAYPPPVGGSKN